RSRATSVTVNIDDPASMEAYRQAQAGMQGSFSKLLAVMENYPTLQTTTSFQGFQTQIEGTENRINVARQDYNTAVQGYNLRVKRYHFSIFAALFRCSENAFYAGDAGSESAPDINFDTK